MKEEEYLKLKKEMGDKILALEEALDLLDEEYMKTNARFKEGDKVAVYRKRNGIEQFAGEAFVSAVTMGIDDIYYHLKRVKKDGTMSKERFYYYSDSDRIELIKPISKT